MQVFYENAAGSHVQIGKNLPCDKMAHLSTTAAIIIHTTSVGRVPTVILRSSEVDRAAAEKILAWIAGYNIAGDAKTQQLRLSHLDNDDFNELVAMHAATYHFRVPRELRGEELRVRRNAHVL
jgi:Ser/Thr protein kinase RdoA (MazF antagonist)